MKHVSFWALFFALILTSCEKSTSFKIKGQLSNDSFDGKSLLLQKINFATGETQILDSATVEGKEFQFNGDATEEPDFHMIVPQNQDDAIPAMTFIKEPGTIQIVIKDAENYTVGGTKINDQFQKMQTEVFALQQKASQMSSKEQQDDLIKQLVTLVYDYVKENIQNPTGEQLFSSVAFQLSADQIKEIMKNAKPEFAQKEEVKTLLKTVEAQENMSKNSQYQDVTMVNTSGNNAKLSDFVGKSEFVLVDFWASWCMPCIQEMPVLTAAYAKYKSKGFEIVSISVDKDKESWVKAIQENNMTWIQLNDVNGEASQTYGVSSIPFTLLIDKNGKIVAKNLRGDQLEQKLSELLN